MKLAIVHGKILTMSDKLKKVIPGGTVLIKEGMIEGVLEKETPIPKEYRDLWKRIVIWELQRKRREWKAMTATKE